MRLTFFLLLCVPLTSAAAGLHLKVSSRSVSEPIAIKELAGDWRGTQHPGDIAWTRNRIELGVDINGWGIAYTQRYDYVLRFNSETADIYYRDKNDLPAPQGDVPVRLHAWHLRAQGVKFQRSFKWRNGVYVTPSVSLLKGWQFQDGEMQGLLRSDSGTFNGQADLDYRYSQDLLLDHQFRTPSGKGLAVDLTLGWRGESRQAWLQFQDIYGALWWRHAPHTHGRLNTMGRGDESVQLDPAFSGRRELKPYRQRLPVYTVGRYVQQQDDWDLQLDAEYFMDRLWLRPGIRWRALLGNPYLGYEVRDGQWALGLGDDRKRWHLQLASDTWRLERARALTLEFGYMVRW
ncbi:MAG: hypothetical protein V7667_00550 [Alloalcanivorax venustensis]|uniref:hypothetical protein n=1 Tax=Alloalcanivorax venustensis TaxID=172371 RepID=UPI0030010368